MKNSDRLKNGNWVLKPEDVRKNIYKPYKIISIFDKDKYPKAVLSHGFDKFLKDLYPIEEGLSKLIAKHEVYVKNRNEELESERVVCENRKGLLNDIIAGDYSDYCIVKGHDMKKVNRNSNVGEADMSVSFKCTHCSKREVRE